MRTDDLRIRRVRPLLAPPILTADGARAAAATDPQDSSSAARRGGYTAGVPRRETTVTTLAIDSGMRRAAAIAVAFVATLAALVAAAFVWVWIYSEFIHPGGDTAYYEAYARVASPVVAVVLAGPVFYGMGVFMRRFATAATAMALAVVGLNLLADAASMVAFAADLGFNLTMSLLAAIAKVAGALLGARSPR